MRENNISIFETFVEQGITTQAQATAWETSCLISMRKAVSRILWSYPCASEEVEDTVHDALKTTLAKIRHKKGKKIENPKEYLVVAAANHAINKAKALNKTKTSISLDENNSFDIASQIISHPKSLEIKAMYKHYLSTLSDKERAVADMLVLQMSRLEIADALSMRENAVNVCVHRLRQKLSPLKEYLNW